MTRVEVEIDPDLGTVLGKSQAEIARDLRLGGALCWYAEGRMSRRQAATVARVSVAELTAALGLMRGVLGGGRECPASGDPPAGHGAPDATGSCRSGARADFELVLLGVPIVRRCHPRGETAEVGWRLRKAFETVAFLALLPGQRATKDELVESLWPEGDSDAVRKNFHPMMSEARRALGTAEAILFRQGSYVLNPEMSWKVDVVDFERLVAEGRELELARAAGDEARPASSGAGADSPPAASREPRDLELRALKLWRRAWELYRGPLLSGLERAWIVPRREALRREYLRVLRGVGRVSRRLALDTLALDAYRSVLVEEPYEEASHLAMMELFARKGRRDLVLRQYSRLQEVLQQELGEEPRSKTQERYHELMRRRGTGR